MALLLQEVSQQGNTILLADRILGHIGIGVATGDVPQGTHRSLNDVLSPVRVADGPQKCLEKK